MNRVWFSCFTAYHLFNSLYYSTKVDWGKDCERTLIWVNDTRIRINVDVFSSCFDKIIKIDSLRDLSFINKQVAKCKNGGRLFNGSVLGKELSRKFDKSVLVCFSDQHYITNKLVNKFKTLENSHVVIVEEGVATYVTNEVYDPPFSTRAGNLLFGLHSQRYVGENANIDTFIVKDPDRLPKEKVLDRKVIKQNNVFCDREWINELLEKYVKKTNDFHGSKPVLLWIGQPLEGNYLEESEEEQIRVRIFERLAAKYQLLVKTHPGERPDKYEGLKPEVSIVDFGEFSWFPIEVLASMIKPQIIVTPMSSAAYNIYQTGFEGKILFCYKLFGIDIGQDYFAELEKKRNIYNVKDMDELESVLSLEDLSIEISEVLNNDDLGFFHDLMI